MNAFAGIDVRLPAKYREALDAYCQTGSGKSRPESNPFPRMVDMWFLALCLAIRQGLSPEFEVTGQTYKAIEGNVFGSDNWRSNALTLLAIAHTDDVEIADKPIEMMKIANAYAIAGLPHLVSILDRKGDTALDHLSDYIVGVIEEGGRDTGSS